MAIIILLVIPLLVTACDSPDQNTDKEIENISSGIISPLDLTAREKSLLVAAGLDKTFIFELDLTSDDIEKVSCFIDYYENGRLQDNISTLKSSIVQADEQNSILAWTTRAEPDSQNEIWVISCDGCSFTTKIDRGEKGTQTWHMASSPCTIEKAKDINLAYIAEGKSGVSGGSIFGEKQENIEGILDNEKVYIWRCRFD